MKVASIITEQDFVNDYARDRELAAAKETGRRQDTAAATYEGYAERCNQMITQIQQAMIAHQQAAAKDPKNWGYSGDLENVLPNLEDILHFLKA